MCRECQGCGEEGEEDVDFDFGHIKLEVPKVNPDEKEMQDWAGHFEAGTVLELEHTQGEITQEEKHVDPDRSTAQTLGKTKLSGETPWKSLWEILLDSQRLSRHIVERYNVTT